MKKFITLLFFGVLFAGEQNEQNAQIEQYDQNRANLIFWTFKGYLSQNDAGVFLGELKIPESLYNEKIKANCALNSPCELGVSYTEVDDGGPAIQPVATDIHSAKAGKLLNAEIKINDIEITESDGLCSITAQINGRNERLFGEFYKVEKLKANELYSVEYVVSLSLADSADEENNEYLYITNIKEKK